MSGKLPLFHAFVSRGVNAGTILYPHRHRDGAFVVSMPRYERDYVRILDPVDILGWLEKGFGLRMSNPAAGILSPSLIEPGAIYRPVVL